MTRLTAKRKTREQEGKERKKDDALWPEMECSRERARNPGQEALYTRPAGGEHNRRKGKKVDRITGATNECHFTRSTNSVTRKGKLTEALEWTTYVTHSSGSRPWQTGVWVVNSAVYPLFGCSRERLPVSSCIEFEPDAQAPSAVDQTSAVVD
ncbi:hypothetical protein BDV59DRAFT_26827 [Aspergillus ambiguus]|uniref:uncharacterized protein n=1 Tax=Aspergillus ambiguus TaxID=176160 RepID=UPI003CCDB5E9